MSLQPETSSLLVTIFKGIREASEHSTQKSTPFAFCWLLESWSKKYQNTKRKMVKPTYHQEFQVPKMEVLNLIRPFWGWVFPYISLTYSLYRWVFLHFRYLKCLVNLGLPDTWSTGVVLIGCVSWAGVCFFFFPWWARKTNREDTFGKLCYMFFNGCECKSGTPYLQQLACI